MPAAGWTLNDSPEMDEEQFRLWQTLLEDRTGMQFTTQRKRFLETSLSMRMREIGCENYSDYHEQLVSGPTGQVEWATLVDRLTVQETSFFRHLSSFNLVRGYCQQLWTQGERKSLEVWSVGCSTGEEPYSLAMLLDELLLELASKQCQSEDQLAPSGNNINSVKLKVNSDQPKFGITATDISLPALSKAREGIYGERKLAYVDAATKEKYFKKIDEHKLPEARYQVVPQLRERVCFARINVLDLGSVPFRDLDIIFCQNLLIYFKRWRKRDIVNALAERLKIGGLLVLGLGEVVDWAHPKIARMPYENTLAFNRIK